MGITIRISRRLSARLFSPKVYVSSQQVMALSLFDLQAHDYVMARRFSLFECDYPKFSYLSPQKMKILSVLPKCFNTSLRDQFYSDALHAIYIITKFTVKSLQYIIFFGLHIGVFEEYVNPVMYLNIPCSKIREGSSVHLHILFFCHC